MREKLEVKKRGSIGKGRCWMGGSGRRGEEHLRIHLLLVNSQEDLSPALESCEVCGSARTPPGNWKRRRGEGGGGEEGQVEEGDTEVGKKRRRKGGWSWLKKKNRRNRRRG